MRRLDELVMRGWASANGLSRPMVYTQSHHMTYDLLFSVINEQIFIMLIADS